MLVFFIFHLLNFLSITILKISTNYIRGVQTYPERASAGVGFPSNQAKATSESAESQARSNRWNQVWLLRDWNENLHPPRPCAVIGHPWPTCQLIPHHPAFYENI